MFDRIKKMFRTKSNQIISASWDYDPTRCGLAWFAGGREVRVLIIDRDAACDLISRIDTAKRHKKKHSHLLAELKALEVK